MERWQEFYNKESKNINISLGLYSLYGQVKIYHPKESNCNSGLMIYIPLGSIVAKEIYDEIKEI